MNTSELARRSGLSVHRLRRYEAEGLLRAERSPAGYRQFGERALREATFIAMGREIGLSLKVLAEALPRYRAGTLSVDEMIDTLRARIAEIDALVAEQRALRRKLVQHIAWFRRRQRAPARRPSPSFPPEPKRARP